MPQDRYCRSSLIRQALLSLALLSAVACSPSGPQSPVPQTWEGVLREARGSRVDVGMWMGDPFINAYMSDHVAETVRQRYGIEMDFISSQGSQTVSALMTEREADARQSAFDMVWINGETFYQLRQIEALYGPFTDRLPNAAWIDFEDPFIGTDFQQPIDGYEAPWGTVQFTLIYDSSRVANPPQTVEQLGQWIRDHPGRFSIDTGFSGLTFLKSLVAGLAGSKDAMDGPFSEQKYLELTRPLWRWLEEIRPFLWNEGRSYPSGVAQMHQLFASGELWFTMSNNDAEVDNKVSSGVFPTSARAYAPTFGTVRNSHYWGIPRHAQDRAAAMVVINFLLSPEAQELKLRAGTWGDGTVLDLARLPDSMRTAFEAAGARRFVPGQDALLPLAIREPSPEWMIRLHADFRRFMIDR